MLLRDVWERGCKQGPKGTDRAFEGRYSLKAFPTEFSQNREPGGG